MNKRNRTFPISKELFLDIYVSFADPESFGLVRVGPTQNISEYDQKIPQSHTADQPLAP